MKSLYKWLCGHVNKKLAQPHVNKIFHVLRQVALHYNNQRHTDFIKIKDRLWFDHLIQEIHPSSGLTSRKLVVPLLLAHPAGQQKSFMNFNSDKGFSLKYRGKERE